MNNDQVVRGPGTKGTQGTFTGIIDTRGVIKVVNAALLMRSSAYREWTPDLDGQLVDWLTAYGKWLGTSPSGKMACTRPKHVKSSITV